MKVLGMRKELRARQLAVIEARLRLGQPRGLGFRVSDGNRLHVFKDAVQVGEETWDNTLSLCRTVSVQTTTAPEDVEGGGQTPQVCQICLWKV